MKTRTLVVLMAAALAAASCSKDPSASFTVSSTEVETQEPVIFTDNSEDGYNAVWDFGDGYYAGGDLRPAGKSVSHDYYDPGEYVVTLTVSDRKEKNFSSASQTITVRYEGYNAEQEARTEVREDIMSKVWNLTSYTFKQEALTDTTFTLTFDNTQLDFYEPWNYMYKEENGEKSIQIWDLENENHLTMDAPFISIFANWLFTIKSLTANQMVLERITSQTASFPVEHTIISTYTIVLNR